MLPPIPVSDNVLKAVAMYKNGKQIVNEIISLRERIEHIRNKLSDIVCTADCDKGVVLLSSDGPTHWNEELQC